MATGTVSRTARNCVGRREPNVSKYSARRRAAPTGADGALLRLYEDRGAVGERTAAIDDHALAAGHAGAYHAGIAEPLAERHRPSPRHHVAAARLRHPD